ncbi:WD40 repeat domain-containing serine/threonine protein kinase [Aporhodopirellula aestuarii]|uniref:WD40 repeat domain-containing serine/threonine protein kinase n=1 Tax=Aporhodopirellula aestuarii TaxID=2950107 RepID=A0ABT0UDE9_9BACT|nr:WD40 repeat domain-containing serine/threonine protein kinase [Aporhodopirellula aestuarii]MCM2374780.1 WD40 repeat domain-containing serine/threonine protein kinase [Aporhodopirellula aestuarii]
MTLDDAYPQPWDDSQDEHLSIRSLIGDELLEGDPSGPVHYEDGSPDNSTRSNDTCRADRPIPTVPSQVARFVIKEELGRGGFGVVHRAYDSVLERDVAIKAISRLRGSRANDERRLHEARATAKMSHPYLVPLYEIIEDGECIYLVSELCPGPTLRQFITKHPDGIEPTWAVEIAIKLAQALSHAHRRGFVHRDIKPSNVLLVPDPFRPNPKAIAESSARTPDSADLFDWLDRSESLPFTPRLTDFGLVRDILDSIQSHEGNHLVGTLTYIAPEQLTREGPVGGAVPELKLGDVYSLGVVIYQMLAGCVPFKAKHPIELIELMAQSEAIPLRERNPKIHRDLDAICMKCLERDPAKRYESIQDLCDDLERYSEGFPIWARPQGRAERAFQFLRRSPVESALVVGLLLMSTIAAVTFAWSNRSLRRQSEVLATAILIASRNEGLAVEAEHRASVALHEAERERIKAEASERAALEVAYQSDLRQAFAAVAAGDSANSLQIAEEIVDYSGAERVQSRYDWRLLKTFARQGWRSLELPASEMPSQVTEVVVIPKRNWVVSTSLKGWLHIHDLSDGRLINSLQLPQQGVLGIGGTVQIHALAASPDGKWLAVGKSRSASIVSWSGISSVEMIDVSNAASDELKVARSFTGFDSTVESLAFSPDSKQIAVGCRYEPIQLITIEDSSQRFKIPAERRNENLLVSTEGELIIVPNLSEIHAVDFNSYEARHFLNKPTGWAPTSLAITKDSKKCFCIHYNLSSVVVYERDGDSQTRYDIDFQRGLLTCLAISEDDEYLVAGTTVGGIAVWKLADIERDKQACISPNESMPCVCHTEPIQYEVRHRGAVSAIDVASNSKVFSGGIDGMLAVTTLKSMPSGDQAACVVDQCNPLFPQEDWKAVDSAVSADGKSVFAMRSDGSVYSIDVERGTTVEEMPARDTWGTVLFYHQGRRWLFVGYADGRVFVKEAAGKRRLFELPRLDAPTTWTVRDILVNSSQDRLIVSTGKNHIYTLVIEVDERDGTPSFIPDAKVHLRRQAADIALTSDEDLLLMGDSFCKYRLGDFSETTLGPGLDFVRASCSDPKEDRILIGTMEGRIYAIDSRGRRKQVSRQWRSDVGTQERHYQILSMVMSPDGKTILSGSQTGEIGIWNASNLRLLGTVSPLSRKRAIMNISISEETGMLVFSDGDPTAYRSDSESRLHLISLTEQ